MAKTEEKTAGKKEKKLASAGQAETRAASGLRETNPWGIILYPHLAEKSMKMVESENKLVFIVKRGSKKKEIKEAVEKAFAVKVTKVNFEVTMKGEKKAYIRLRPEFSAADIATRMGMV